MTLANFTGRRVYIAGPMTGIPHFNAAAFDAAQARIHRQGALAIFNPAAHDRKINGHDFFELCPTGSVIEARNAGFDLRSAMSDDLQWICEEATDIYMLHGWEKSTGARIEHALASMLGIEIHYE